MLNKTIIDNINIEDIHEELFDLEGLVNEVKQELGESNILVSSKDINKNFIKQQSLGNFEDDFWIMRNLLNESYVYFDFLEFNKLKFKGVTNNDIRLIKCWIAEYMIDLKYDYGDEIEYRSAERLRKGYRVILNFIKESSNFSINYLDDTKGFKLDYYFDNGKGDQTKAFEIGMILSYINYITDKVDNNNLSNLAEYVVKLKIKLNELNIKFYVRQLPTSKDILLFADYIEIFFKDENVVEELKLYFMPILLWWKIASVIPMRVSEFARKIKRQPLSIEGEYYYLKINRVKKKASVKDKLLPVLNRIKITEEIYTLVNDYITKTDKYGSSETLISYKAILNLRCNINELYPELGIGNDNRRKINEEAFTAKILTNMLERFYDTVIVHLYKDRYIKQRLRLGDVRHIAFTSLMLQGYSPVEIAIIGGHRTLQSLDNYTCSINTYVDSEVVSIIKKNINIKTKNNSEIIDKILQMPVKCPVQLEKCFEAEIDGENLGYCTTDYKNNPQINHCESEYCDKCSKWWCEPSEYNFLKLEKIVKNRLMNKDNKLKRDISFLLSLMKEVGLKVIDGKLAMEKQVVQGLRRISMELNSNTKDIIHLKYILINPSEDNFRLLSDLEDLLPIEEVNKVIQEKTIEIKSDWEDKIIWQDPKIE